LPKSNVVGYLAGYPVERIHRDVQKLILQRML
jgi:hypothetical protein